MPASTTPATAVPKDDANELEKKQKELNAIKSTLDDATKKAAALSDEIKTLTARIAEVKKASDQYAASIQVQQKILDDVGGVINQKFTMAAAGAKNQKDAIDAVVKAIDADIAAHANKVTSVQKSVKKAQEELSVAEGALKQKQDDYSTTKESQKATDAQIKQIKSLTDLAAKSELQGDINSMYFLLQEAQQLLEKVAISPPDEFMNKVAALQSDLEAAKSTVAAKKTDLDAQNKQLADAQKEANDAASGRQVAILGRLKDLKVGAGPAPAPSPTSKKDSQLQPAPAPSPSDGQS